MKQFLFDIGDTNFLALVNAETYHSFVNEDWTLGELFSHWGNEAKEGNILVFGMTQEGTQANWRIGVGFKEAEEQTYYKKATGAIKVTDNSLYIVEYNCLTMAAQFNDCKVPDKNCEKFKIELANGVYQVVATQFYNADQDAHIGRDNCDLTFSFAKQNSSESFSANKGVYWFSAQ